jgi:6-phosphogluconolactonase
VVAKGAGRVDEAYPKLLISKVPVDTAANLVLSNLPSNLPRFAIAGGSVLRALGVIRQKLGNDRFRQVRLCWADERCVPFNHTDSNRGAAYRDGYLEESAPPKFELPLYLDGETPPDACARVSAQLSDVFENGVDVSLLGLGEDGHIASLFPGHIALESSATVVAVASSPKPPPSRISLTLRTLNTARTTVILATGEAKRYAIQRLLSRDTSVPAAQLSRVYVVTDLEID